jgi:hypothetical protein
LQHRGVHEGMVLYKTTVMQSRLPQDDLMLCRPHGKVGPSHDERLSDAEAALE